MSDTLADSTDAPRPAQLLSRYAGSIFWLARQMERTENLARILDVTETFTRHARDEEGWLAVVRINADEARFFATHAAPTAQAVTHFYVLDRDNPTSIAATLAQARENARLLRPLISTEMWSQINIFHHRMRQLNAADIAPSHLSQLCADIKQACQTHTGITEGTFYRDAGWTFYMLGRHIERADQITRLVDIKYHMLLPSADAVGSALDVGQWHALLRAAAGYHAFRRKFPRDMTPAMVAGFLLLNHGFPRSLVHSVRLTQATLAQLRSSYRLRGADAALERLEDLSAVLTETSIDTLIARGLHEFLDWVQRELIGLHATIAARFWPAEG